jgi:two-component system sensor histidine kinase TctE
VAVVVVQRATRPVRGSARTQGAPEGDLTPSPRPTRRANCCPLIDATNQVMGRLQHLLDNQKRFVRDAAHQLRTPLAVLKAQVQSALRGDVEPARGARRDQPDGGPRHAAGQPDAVAGQGGAAAPAGRPAGIDLAQVVRSVALDLSPLIADKDIDFEIETVPVRGRTNGCWANSRATCCTTPSSTRRPAAAGGAHRAARDSFVVLTVSDSGPGMSAELRRGCSQPFSAGDVRQRLGPGPGDLPRDRAGAARAHHPGQPGRARPGDRAWTRWSA